MNQDKLPFRVAALYQFAPMDSLPALRAELLQRCQAEGICGTLLLAAEGINGTIAGSDSGIAAVIRHIRSLPGCAALDVKYSRAAAAPFKRMKVRIKAEIVTMGQPQVDPLSGTGHYLDPSDWNRLIADPDTVVIDTRNDYEVAIGTFRKAINPQTRSFREFPGWFRDRRQDLLGGTRPRKVAMFCTGGIRCEKSTAFLKGEGVDEVYHLKGGILKYLETIPEEQSLWEGECFVFDERVSIGHGLVAGTCTGCPDCGRPIARDAVCAHCQAREQRP